MFRWMVHLKGEERYYHRAVVVGLKLYIFMDSKYDTDHMEMYIFNTVSLRWMKLSPVTNGRGDHPLEIPTRRMSYTAVLIEDIIYIWGGHDFWSQQFYNVLYAFDVDTHKWFKPKVSGTVPDARCEHSACVLVKVMYIHGGWTTDEYTNNIYKLDTTTMVWSLINSRGTCPPVSACHSSTIIGKNMFVIGGYHSTLNIRVFDTETNCWLSTPSQLLSGGRTGHSAFAYNEELYIFGGDNINLTFDISKFNPKSFSWNKVETKGQSPPQTFYMCCCMVGDRIVIVGGCNLTLYGRNQVRTNRFTSTYDLYILDLSPSLKMLCKLAVIHYGLDRSELPHDIRWELTIDCKKEMDKVSLQTYVS